MVGVSPVLSRTRTSKRLSRMRRGGTRGFKNTRTGASRRLRCYTELYSIPSLRSQAFFISEISPIPMESPIGTRRLTHRKKKRSPFLSTPLHRLLPSPSLLSSNYLVFFEQYFLTAPGILQRIVGSLKEPNKEQRIEGFRKLQKPSGVCK